MKGHTARINSLSFSPDGSRIVTVSDDCSIKIWFFFKPSIPILLFDITKFRSLILDYAIIDNCLNLSAINEKIF